MFALLARYVCVLFVVVFFCRDALCVLSCFRGCTLGPLALDILLSASFMALLLRRCFFADVFNVRMAQGGDMGTPYFREAIGWRYKRKRKK